MPVTITTEFNNSIDKIEEQARAAVRQGVPLADACPCMPHTLCGFIFIQAYDAAVAAESGE